VDNANEASHAQNSSLRGFGLSDRALVVVAHPDDETFWFSSVIARRRADVLCVTASPDAGTRARRGREFRQACQMLGAASAQQLDHADLPGIRLDLARLERDLQPFAARGYGEVFTHGVLGEPHEHPHHQDVCCAVHRSFTNVWSNAWNQYPALRQELTAAEYALKKRILGTVYWREYVKLRRIYEIAAVESFCRHACAGVDALHRTLAAAAPNARPGMVFDNPLGREGAQALECHRRLAALLQPHSPRRLLSVGSTCPSLQRLLHDSLGASLTASITVDGQPDCDAVIAAFDSREALERAGLLGRAPARLLLLVSPARQQTLALLKLLSPGYALKGRSLVPPHWGPLQDVPQAMQAEVYKAPIVLSLLERQASA
jgi:LmbE family N-acetylglucosaminyl deacetylase